jgi:uncharacterized iron-regulated membrane protein
MITLRRSIFWIHLACGLAAGGVIAIMSVTGVAIAFEQEILAWADREASRIPALTIEARPRPLEQLRADIQATRPDFPVTGFEVPRDPAKAYTAYSGWGNKLYVNPYTGELRASEAKGVHDVIHLLEEWHRWLAFPEEHYLTGKLITGICNLAFLGLCLTGLYLWWPKALRWPALKRSLWFAKTKTAKAREFNWHNVFGIWSLPVLVVLVATAVAISFAWGHRLVFAAFGEEAPKSRNYGMMAVAPPTVPTPPSGTQPVSLATAIAELSATFPEWETIGVQFPRPGTVSDTAILPPLDFGVTVPDTMPSRAFIPVKSNPYTGEILQAVRFQDRSPGLQARVWVRFIHTGAAFGLVGKIVATAATLASLVLVYTGFALSWRRFFSRRHQATATAAN